jgi:hypothetical protein
MGNRRIVIRLPVGLLYTLPFTGFRRILGSCSVLSNKYSVLSPRFKRSGRDADNSPHFCADVKKLLHMFLWRSAQVQLDIFTCIYIQRRCDYNITRNQPYFTFFSKQLLAFLSPVSWITLKQSVK